MTPYIAGYGSGGGGGGDADGYAGQPGGANAGAGGAGATVLGEALAAGASATPFYGGGGGGSGCAGPTGGAGGSGTVIIDDVTPSPDTIANLKLCLKADALSLNDGDAVATWSDSSVNAYSVTQGTTDYQPIFKTNQINGNPVLRFNGSHMFLMGNFTGSITDKTMFVVVRLATLTPSGQGCDPVSIQSGPSANFDAIVYAEYTPKRWQNGSDYNHRTPNTVSPINETSTSPLLIAIRSTTSSYILYRNGSQLSSTTSYSPITFTK